MSVKIDVTQPLTDAEIEYLESRGRTADIARNRRTFGTSATVTDPPAGHDPRAEGAGATEQADWEDAVEELNTEELRAALKERDLDSKGNQAALQKRLKEAGPPRT